MVVCVPEIHSRQYRRFYSKNQQFFSGNRFPEKISEVTNVIRTPFSPVVFTNYHSISNSFALRKNFWYSNFYFCIDISVVQVTIDVTDEKGCCIMSLRKSEKVVIAMKNGMFWHCDLYRLFGEREYQIQTIMFKN